MINSYIKSVLGQNEEVLLITHQHWFVWLHAIYKALLIIISILILFNVAQVISPAIPFVYGNVLLIIPLVSVIYQLLLWENRQFLVTSRRVIQTSGFINKDVIDSSLDKVNDIKMTQSIFGRMFNYGDIEILTASELGINLFETINDPRKFKLVLINAKEELENGRNDDTDNNEIRPEDIPELIANLNELRIQGTLTNDEFQQKKTELLQKI
jgi:uncharacterized membrane protein YdbT with pleckstrin-like domain